MSVRRLADESVQPKSFAFNEANSAWAAETIRKYPEGRQQSAVIPLLMRAQEQEGWVTRAAIETVADMLQMAYIRVLEVATFYTQFQIKPVGTRAHIQVCGTTPCMLRGAEELISVCKKKIHPEALHTNESGTLSWEEVECQGACVNAPMVVIGKDTYEDLTPTHFEHIIDRFEAGRGRDVAPGPQVDRVFSAPMGGPVTLTGDTGNMQKKTPAVPQPTDGDEPSQKARPKGSTPKPVEGAIAAGQGVPSLDDPDRPAAVEKPAKPDDLKMISGVGPVMEAKLHDLGIYTFAQIAKWTDKEVTWVDGYLSFRGRIQRDDWIKQADALARGGEEEYIRVFGKKPR